MTLSDFLIKQKELDEIILKNARIQFTPIELIHSKMTALSCEIAELNEELGYFKYWKKNKRNDIDKQRTEFIDILFFWLSIGNQLGFTAEELEKEYLHKWEENKKRQENGY